MKNITFLLVFCIASCNKNVSAPEIRITKQDTPITKQDTSITKQDTPITKQDIPIYSVWQLVEEFGDIPGSASSAGGWKDVSNGFILELKADYTFVSNQFSECSTGKFQIIKDTITFMYACERFTAGFERPKGTFSYTYISTNSILQLNPANFQCYEGCAQRFKKIIKYK